MKKHKQYGLVVLSMMWLILLTFCPTVIAYAETSELSDGDEKGISLSTTVPPSIISGDDAVYEKGGASGLLFTTDDTTDNLLRVLVDGKVASPENYSVTGEPLAVTLHAGYLDTLSAGEHTIEIVTVNGTAKAEFTIKVVSGDIPGTDVPLAIPSTGDDSNIALWGILMSIAGASCIAILVLNRRIRKRKR